MKIEVMRYELMKTPKYDSPKWHSKVMAMKRSQVVAVYNDFLKKGLFDKPKTTHKTIERQMTIYDFMNSDKEIDFSKGANYENFETCIKGREKVNF